MSGLRKAFKYLLPFGVVEIARNRGRLRELGRGLTARDWWRSEWLVHEAEVSGLDLFPPGHWRNLHTVVDVGANVGQWSTMLLDLISPSKLIVVEPEPRAFAELRRQFGHDAGGKRSVVSEFRRNTDATERIPPVLRPHVELHNVAVGDRNGVTPFKVTRDTTGASVLPPREAMRDLIGQNWTVEAEIEVPMVTLDTLLSAVAEISLLKIDVQGLEREVLAGAAQTLARTDFLLIELNYMRQYEGGSWFGELHELITRDHPFVLVDASKPLRLNGRASMSDGLYVHTARLPDFARRDFL